MAETVSEATRERITEAAAQAVRHAPVASLTVADVAEAAGVTSSSIYKAYSNKYELFAEASRRVLVAQIGEVAGTVDESVRPLDRLRHVLVELLRVCSEQPFALAYLYGLFPLVHHGDVAPEMQARVDHVDDEVRARIRHRIVDALEASDLRGDPDVLTELCRVSVFGYLGDAVHGDLPIPPDVFADFVLAGLAAVGERDGIPHP